MTHLQFQWASQAGNGRITILLGLLWRWRGACARFLNEIGPNINFFAITVLLLTRLTATPPPRDTNLWGNSQCKIFAGVALRRKLSVRHSSSKVNIQLTALSFTPVNNAVHPTAGASATVAPSHRISHFPRSPPTLLMLTLGSVGNNLGHSELSVSGGKQLSLKVPAEFVLYTNREAHVKN